MKPDDYMGLLIRPDLAGIHRKALVEDGPCYSRPPLVHHWDGEGGGSPRRWEITGNLPPRPPWVPALVLKWDGFPVPEGIDRYQRWFGTVFGDPDMRTSDRTVLRWLVGVPGRVLQGCAVILVGPTGLEIER